MTARRHSPPTALWAAFTDNLGTKIISLIIACVLWVIVLGSRNVEVVKEIPLEIVTSSDVVVGNEVPDRVSFRLSGPKAFLRAVLDRREDPIRVNLNGYKPQVLTYQFFAGNIHVPIGVKVLGVSPASTQIRLELSKKKEVPVRIDLRGTPPDGYKILKAEIKPSMVHIRGAESRVQSVTELMTDPIDVSDLKQSIEREAPLNMSRYNVQLDGPLPILTVQLETATANFKIKNIEVKVNTSLKYQLDDKTVTILVRAFSKDLKDLDRSQVVAIVDLRDRPKGHYVEPVKVTVPGEIGVVKILPEKVGVTLY